MTQSRGPLAGQLQSWKYMFLEVLSAAGLRKSEADYLLRNEPALKKWIAQLPAIVSEGLSLAEARKDELARLAETITEHRVLPETPLDQLGLTIRTLSVYQVRLQTVDDVLGSTTSSPNPEREEIMPGVREELRNRLIVGGVPEDQLPAWLRAR